MRMKCVYASCACLVLVEARREHQIPWSSRLCVAMWVLGVHQDLWKNSRCSSPISQPSPAFEDSVSVASVEVSTDLCSNDQSFVF